MSAPEVLLKTDTFMIDKLRAEDASGLSRMMVSNKKRFARFFPMTLAQNLSEEASKAYILLKNIEIGYKSEFTFAIRDSKSQNVVGLLILKEIDWEKMQGEMAYCIDRKYEGLGWTSRAITAFSQFALDELGLKKLQILVHHSNKASTRVAVKSGYIWSRTLSKAYTPPDEIALDMELYELCI
ncbi:GNAT family N-acetyltransferase [Pareuzebyella sediminis]|uniref:GNAT family N-acetyltransferase n=1 Tax=Pareuzebyella sediminis TaxID=2607998 RepID=UPI0011ECD788|nr:GNAT family N-acetyltransferase [Pareuzebyella sediminis]